MNPRGSWEINNRKAYITHDETCHEFSTGITAVYTTLRLRMVKAFHTSFSELTNHVDTYAKPMHVISQAAYHVKESTSAQKSMA
jgi:alpha-D-ribose 1-methylphosphonate 5-triphosphate diphosphatase PhnM